MTAILGFIGKYRFLSNFWPAEVELDGLKYSSIEHAYQAAKTDNPSERRKIRESKKPGDAKRLGQNVEKRTDWEEIKIQVMEDLVRQKFTNDKELKEKLLETGDAYLEETNSWGDVFYGVCKGKGHNHLGKILMRVRDSLTPVKIC